MAFDLQTNNLSGIAVIDQPGGVLATQDNFIDLYDYAQQYQPKLMKDLHLANGLGKITPLLRLIGAEDYYASDKIKHMEQGRLHNLLKDVTIAGTTFTSPTPHMLEAGKTIKFSDGVAEFQATVTSITDATTFEATNDDGTDFTSVAGEVDVIADFGSSWGKGTENFTQTHRWNPTPYENFTHIHKNLYEISESDMRHMSWVDTPQGPKWFNFEMQRTIDLFENEVELLQTLHTRKSTGSAKGVKGIVQQIEERGNIANDYIQTIDEMSEIARRIKQQNPTVVECTIWHDHQQGAYFRQMMGSINSAYAGGAFYGMFNNSKDMALKLDFKSLYIDGITFHFTPWKTLEDPSLLGSPKFLSTNIACLIVPMGKTSVSEDGETKSRPYLSTQYRGKDRKRQVKIFGTNGTPQVKDASSTNLLSEFLNQVVGANSYFIVRRGAFYV